MVNSDSFKIEKPNVLLIAGNGRNVGKTYLACKIIEQLSKFGKVTGIKISSHFHPVNEKDVVLKTKNFVIAEENEINRKDTSRMLQAGAEKVYFVMAQQKNLNSAFFELNKILPNGAIVCESGGLNEIITPGAFLFVKRGKERIIKDSYLRFNTEVVENDGQKIDFDLQSVSFENNRVVIKKDG